MIKLRVLYFNPIGWFTDKGKKRMNSLTNKAIEKYPHVAEEIRMLLDPIAPPTPLPYGVIRNTNHAFFSPLERAKMTYGAPDKNLVYSFLTITTRLLVAFSAAALALNPSKKYAETEQKNIIIYQLSSVSTALLINLYGINYLIDELKYVQRVRPIMIVSTLLGIMSALPIFFMQQLVNEDKSLLSLGASIAITIGSMPMQILGFLEFCEHVAPKIQRFYLYYLSRQPDAVALNELSVMTAFLQQLEVNFSRRILHNEIPANLLQSPNDELMRVFLMEDEVTAATHDMDSYIKKVSTFIMGCLGLFLAEVVNFSFTKATYVSMPPNLYGAVAILLTACITFPAAVLSAEFGFDAACAIYQSFLSGIYQLLRANTFNDVGLQLRPSIGLHPVAELITLLMVLCIVSCSYAPSVQFNRELFEASLSPAQLTELNYATIIGTLLFNSYVLNRISYSFLAHALGRFGDAQVKERAKFYRFSQIVLTGYEKMPKNLIVEGVENILERDASDNATWFSPINL